MSDLRGLLDMPRHHRRLTASRKELRALQESGLRRLLAVAKRASPFHARRLRNIDPDRFELDDLPQLPSMTKADVLDNFDEIVTDSRVTLDGAFAHVREHGGGELMLDEYRVVTSAGSSGRVCVWIYDRRAWRELQAANLRMSVRDHLRHPLDLLRKQTIAVVAATTDSHLSIQAARGFGNRFVELVEFPVSTPLPELASRLEALQPGTLSGYPSILAELARASLQGALRIHPRRVVTSAEPLLAPQRAAVEEAWGLTIANVWAASEGGSLAVGCFLAPGMHLSEDQILFEPLREDGTPCEPREPACKLFITNLFNHAFPLLRYELDDGIALTDEPCACGSTLRRIEDMQARFEELFDYGDGIKLHMHEVRTTLYRLETAMVDYQVFQTRRGLRVVLRARAGANITAVEDELRERLRSHGIAHPEVAVDLDAPLRRLPSGKLERYVPLQSEGLQRDEQLRA
jgi:phenylacetate-coenzyme A ligase PaaK-like adenylate-forming protein